MIVSGCFSKIAHNSRLYARPFFIADVLSLLMHSPQFVTIRPQVRVLEVRIVLLFRSSVQMFVHLRMLLFYSYSASIERFICKKSVVETTRKKHNNASSVPFYYPFTTRL